MGLNMNTKYFVDTDGNYLGAFSGYQPEPILIEPEEGEPYYEEQAYVWPEFPVGAIEVPSSPNHGLDKWINGKWVPYVENAIQINRAQLEQQLIIDGKDELVLTVIESIEDETKRKMVMARYKSETNFKIDDPDLLMLAPALGYDTPEKIQDFFNKASKF